MIQAAAIIMTIMGCDDTATQCHYVDKVDQKWASVEACDKDSEERLKAYSKVNYPVVVAVCQTPGTQEAQAPEIAPETAPSAETAEMSPPEPITADTAKPVEESGLASRVLESMRSVLPRAETVKSIVTKPVHVVTDSYAWVARKF